MPPTPADVRGRAKALRHGQWKDILRGLREGKSPYVLATELRLNYRTVTKARDQGLIVRKADGSFEAMPPIGPLLHEEQTGARAVVAAVDGTPVVEVAPAAPGAPAPPPPAAPDPAALARAVAAGRVPPKVSDALAMGDATAALADELRLVRVARSNVAGLVGVTGNLLLGCRKLSQRIQASLDHVTVRDGNKEDITEAVRVVGAVALMAKMSAEAARIVVQAERLVGGAPQASPSPAGAPSPAYEASAEEASAELARLAPFVKKYGHLRSIPGGAQEADPTPTEDAGQKAEASG